MEKETKILAYIAVISIVIIMIASCISAVAQTRTEQATDNVPENMVSELSSNGGKVYYVFNGGSTTAYSSTEYITVKSVISHDNYGMKVQGAVKYSSDTTIYIPYNNIVYVVLNK